MKSSIGKSLLSLLAALAFSSSGMADGDTLTIPAGSLLHVRLNTTLSTTTNQNGDPFTGTVEEPIISHGEEIVPEGSTVEGHVTFVKPPGRVKGPGEMRLVADSITTPNDVKYQIVAGLEDAQGAPGTKVSGDEGTIKGPGKSKKSAAKETGVDAGVGAGVGAIADGGTGALYGAGIGAIVGIIHNLGKKHKGIVLPQGTEFTFVISRATTAKKVGGEANLPGR